MRLDDFGDNSAVCRSEYESSRISRTIAGRIQTILSGDGVRVDTIPRRQVQPQVRGDNRQF